MDRAVVVDHLFKDFEVVERGAGVSGAVASLFRPKKRTVHALKGLSFSILAGELVGFIGPNGAGKTTALKTLAGILSPTSGFVSVLGYNPTDRKKEFLKNIALVMGQKNQLWWDLPAIETFELNKAIYEIPDKLYRDTLKDLVKLLEVEEYLHTPVRKLSLGQRMRMEFVASLLHRPRVLFLDEPTVGLDVVAQARVRDFVRDYNRRYESTILLTSHNMGDLINVVQRVIVVDNGEIIFDGEFRELIRRFARNKIIKVYFSKDVNLGSLEKIGEIDQVNLPEVVISVPREASAAAAAELLAEFPVADLTIEEQPIEDVVRVVFGGEV